MEYLPAEPASASFTLEYLVLAGFIVVALLTIGIIFAKLYVRAPKDVAFVRTGLGGQRVIKDGGALKLPVLHDITWVNLRTLRLEVRRQREGAMITFDRMRVDIGVEFYVRVKPDRESIALAAQTLGERTIESEKLRDLVEAKFVDALRGVAAQMVLNDLHEKRQDFVQKVQNTVAGDLEQNGLELEAVSLTSLDQTSAEFFNPNNAFDAEGLTRLTEVTERKKKERNEIEQEARIAIEQRNLDADRRAFEINQDCGQGGRVQTPGGGSLDPGAARGPGKADRLGPRRRAGAPGEGDHRGQQVARRIQGPGRGKRGPGRGGRRRGEGQDCGPRRRGRAPEGGRHRGRQGGRREGRGRGHRCRHG